jgi:LuxR family transcriptional regulator, maltose regulon positive regulatory protein
VTMAHGKVLSTVTTLPDPEPLSGFVPRRSLIDRLGHSDAPVVVITGPAGYGKTTLLSQYARSDPRPTAWLTVDGSDSAQDVFLGRLLNALSMFEPLDADRVSVISLDEPTSVVDLSMVGPMLGRLQPFILLIDDVHLIRSPEALEVLIEVSNCIAPGSTLALASRTTPAIRIGKLRALRRILEIGREDLAFNDAEAAVLVKALGPELGKKDVKHLADYAQGWAAGIYLAALSFSRERHDVARFSGRDRLITDYFWDEPLRTLPEPTVEFLIQSSALQILTGTVCDAILNRTGSGALLRELDRSNLFIVPLDGEERSYRYHGLFADALRAELRRRDPKGEREIHARASNWYALHGDLDGAIRHATEAGDTARAASLLWGNIAPGHRLSAEALERRLQAFSEEELAMHPLLALARAWLSVEQGDGRRIDKFVSIAERGYFRGTLPGGPAALEAAVNLLRAILGRDGIAAMAQNSSRAFDLDVDRYGWRGVARYFQGMALRLQGDREAAKEALEDCERRCRWTTPSTHAECLAQLSLIALEDEDRPRAESLSAQAIDEVREFDLDDRPLNAIVFALSALLNAQRGDHIAARSHLGQATSLVTRYSYFAPWLDVQCRILIAWAHLSLSDGAAARRLSLETRLLLRDLPDVPVLGDWMDEVSVAAERFLLPSRSGGASLSPAELRILRELPTHLSVPEIAARLFVSRNTVKSQVASVYRKLGVASRADAVDRARVLGLITFTTNHP